MSLDKSLKSKNLLERHRNVLTRAERIEHLKEVDAWTEGQSPMGLPKIVHRKVAVGKKTKAKKDDDEAATGEETKEETT